MCVGAQMGRTALHYAAVLTDEGTLYNTLKEAGADETITDSVSTLPLGDKLSHIYAINVPTGTTYIYIYTLIVTHSISEFAYTVFKKRRRRRRKS